MEAILLEENRARAKNAWRSAVWTLTLILFLAVFAAISNYRISPVTQWQNGMLTVVSVVNLIILYLRRKTPTESLALACYLCGVIFTCLTLGITHRQLALSTEQFNPFNNIRLLALALSLLAPPRVWAGGLVIGILGVYSVLEYSLNPAMRSLASPQEPWLTIALLIAMAGFLTKKVNEDQVEIDLAREHAQSAALAKRMKTYLMMNDWMGSPLQSLLLLVAVIERKKPEISALTTQMKSALQAIVEPGKGLRAQVAKMHWPAEGTSFSSKDSLAHLIHTPQVERSLEQEKALSYDQNWRLTIWFIASFLLAHVVAGYGNIQIPGVASWPSYAQVIIDAVALLVMFSKRRSQSNKWVGICFLAVIFGSIFTGSVNQFQLARAAPNFTPFEIVKVFTVIFGLIAPPVPWIGIPSIVGFTLAGEIGFALLASDAQTHSLREPAQMIMGCIVGLFLFWRRVRNRKIRMQLAYERAENQVMRETQKDLDQIRASISDSMGTLWNSVNVLEKDFPELRDQVDLLKINLKRLNELQAVISEKDAK